MIAHWITLLVAGLVFGKATMPDRPKPMPSRAGFIAIEKQAAKVAEITHRIQVLERMIVDVEMCDPDELHTKFRTTWESGGENRTYDFWSDGEYGTSTDLLIFAKRERERLRASLLIEIDRLYSLRCTQNVSWTDPDTEGEGVR